MQLIIDENKSKMFRRLINTSKFCAKLLRTETKIIFKPKRDWVTEEFQATQKAGICDPRRRLAQLRNEGNKMKFEFKADFCKKIVQ